ncbi:MAG: hypothetical protein IKN30_02110, partial [Synergistaceae bacterium]|nr:hypothetical protein [Synergistaceae bacterium]
REPGFFDALMSEYTPQEETEPINIELNSNLISFKGSNLFSGSVIEILADMDAPELLNNFPETEGTENLFAQLKNSLAEVKNSQPEVFYTDEEINFNENISQLLNMTEEELNEKLSSLPEETQQGIKNLIEEIINSVKNGEDIKTSVKKLSNLLSENEIKSEPEVKNKIEIKNENKDDDDEENEIKTH